MELSPFSSFVTDDSDSDLSSSGDSVFSVSSSSGDEDNAPESDDDDESDEETSRFLACLMDESELHPEELFHTGTSFIVRKKDSGAQAAVHFRKALYYFQV